MTERLQVNPGDRYGRLTITEEIAQHVSPSGGKNRMFACKCDCGKATSVLLMSLRRGAAKSCGCRQRIKHGLTKSPLHRLWTGMRQRCNNPNSQHYSYYGGRGISICERWNTFESFAEDMGERPEGLTIERIDNNGNYEPGNCRWASMAEQQLNTRRNRLLTHKGITQCLTVWAETIGVSDGCLRHRLIAGWTLEAALEEPLSPGVRPDGCEAMS